MCAYIETTATTVWILKITNNLGHKYCVGAVYCCIYVTCHLKFVNTHKHWASASNVQRNNNKTKNDVCDINNMWVGIFVMF